MGVAAEESAEILSGLLLSSVGALARRGTVLGVVGVVTGRNGVMEAGVLELGPAEAGPDPAGTVVIR